MQLLKRVLIVVVVAVLATACGDFLDASEDNPNAVTDVDINNVFVGATVDYAQNQVIELGVGHATHAESWSTPFFAYNVYSISRNARSNSWGRLYGDVGAQTASIIEQARESGDTYAVAQALLLQQYALMEVTLIWEQAPYTQALAIEEFTEPEFDSQRDILEGIIRRAQEAAVLLQDNSGGGAMTNGDLIYGGDTNRWVRFANALQLRANILLEGGGVDRSTQLDSLLSLSDAQVIRTNASNAETPYPGGDLGQSNPLYQFQIGVGFVPIEDFPIWLGGEGIINLMNDLSDPRRSTYFGALSDGSFEGRPAGDEAGQFGFSPISTNIIREDFPIRMFTAGEVLLLEAEAALITGDPALAQEKFEAGVRASIDYFDEKPGAIDDADRDAYVTSLGTVSFQKIHEQQYIDLFERGTLVWTQQRRTNVPSLDAPSDAPIGGVLSRWPYPDDVATINDNTPANPPLDSDMFFESEASN